MVDLFWLRTDSILETLQRRGLWDRVSPSPDRGGGHMLRRSLLCLGFFQLPSSFLGWLGSPSPLQSFLIFTPLFLSEPVSQALPIQLPPSEGPSWERGYRLGRLRMLS